MEFVELFNYSVKCLKEIKKQKNSYRFTQNLK